MPYANILKKNTEKTVKATETAVKESVKETIKQNFKDIQEAKQTTTIHLGNERNTVAAIGYILAHFHNSQHPGTFLNK